MERTIAVLLGLLIQMYDSIVSTGLQKAGEDVERALDYGSLVCGFII